MTVETKKDAGESPSRGGPALGLAAIIAAIVGVFLLRSLLVSFTMAQNGMYPGKPAGTRVLVNKWAYSGPGDVERGDVLAFEVEQDGSANVNVWRVVGLPGDGVRLQGETVVVNGKPLEAGADRDS